MSVILDIFKEELERLKDEEISFRKSLEEENLPKGYISKKIINGCECYYLQWREEHQVKNKQIKKEDLEIMQYKVGRRKYLEQALKQIEKDRKILMRILE